MTLSLNSSGVKHSLFDTWFSFFNPAEIPLDPTTPLQRLFVVFII